MRGGVIQEGAGQWGGGGEVEIMAGRFASDSDRGRNRLTDVFLYLLGAKFESEDAAGR